MAIVAFFACFLLVKGFWVIRDYCFRAEDDRKYKKSTPLSRSFTLVATVLGIIFLVLGIKADGASISWNLHSHFWTWITA